MDYMDVYTPYTLFFASIITICVMISALLNAYIAIKVRKDLLFWKHFLVQTVFLIWLCGKLLELVSPTQAFINMNLTVQKIGVSLLFPALLLFLFVPAKYKMDRKLIFRLCAVSVAVLVCAAAIFFSVPEWVLDFSPVCTFLLWNVVTFFQRRNIFAELSNMSIDAFMDKIEDAVLIFDRSQKLMDSNQNAKILFSFIDTTLTIEDFYCRINERIVSGNMLSAIDAACFEPTEIGLEVSGKTRYFQYCATTVKNKKNISSATILTFHDVTEKALLLRELEHKNARLDELNDALKNYIRVAHRLEDEQEKNRAVMEIQQTIGQSVAELLIGLEALKTVGSTQEETIKNKLSQMIENCRTVMSDIRQSVERLTSHNTEPH